MASQEGRESIIGDRMKLLPILLFCIALPVYAGGNHYKPPEPVPDDGSNHNALAIGIVVVAATVCIVNKCWKPKPVKAETSLVPEPPRNEYTYTIKP